MYRIVETIIVTDSDFSDDITLLSEEVDQVQELLKRVESEAGKIGLKINATETKFIVLSQPTKIALTTRNVSHLESVNDFKYLRFLINTAKK